MIADLRGRTVLFVAVPPPLVQAFDIAFVEHGATCIVANAADFDAALERLVGDGRGLDALICGGFPCTPHVASFDEYDIDALLRVIADGPWPTFAWLQRVRAVLGRFPRSVITLSSMAPDRFVAGADFSAAGEAVLETLCRYANERLAAENSRMNVLRHRIALEGEADAGARSFATPDEVARAAVALCSGLLDSMRGQVLTVDRGAGFGDNVFRLFEDHGALGK